MTVGERAGSWWRDVLPPILAVESLFLSIVWLGLLRGEPFLLGVFLIALACRDTARGALRQRRLDNSAENSAGELRK